MLSDANRKLVLKAVRKGNATRATRRILSDPHNGGQHPSTLLAEKRRNRCRRLLVRTPPEAIRPKANGPSCRTKKPMGKWRSLGNSGGAMRLPGALAIPSMKWPAEESSVVWVPTGHLVPRCPDGAGSMCEARHRGRTNVITKRNGMIPSPPKRLLGPPERATPSQTIKSR